MTTDATGTGSAALDYAEDPAAYFGYSYTRMHGIARADLESLQLEALQLRFEQLYRTVPMLRKLADRQRFDGIRRIDDVVPLLFEHTMYKSYPPSLLENGRFDQLTHWLNKLTAHDLSRLDTSACTGITDWIELLDRETPMMISHSSGSSGVMSFNPISKDENRRFAKVWPVTYFQEFGDPAPAPDRHVPNVHVVSPTFRHGANAFIRCTDMFASGIAGSEERVHTLYPGRLDSDVLYLAGRIRAARLKGDVEKLKISPHLLARQKKFEAQQARMADDLDRFYERILRELAGQRVFIMTTWNQIYDLAQNGLRRGMRSVFAPDSVVVSGGGAKGMVRPDNWAEPVIEFTGVSRLKGGYGMSEICGSHVMCRFGHYHILPWIIPFLLDPDDSGTVLPRKGRVTGRAAFYDLLANSHWGGFISGDEITLHFDGDCPCGASSVYMDDRVERYSDKRGGDDKISCAATPEAHREAMDFLTRYESAP